MGKDCVHSSASRQRLDRPHPAPHRGAAGSRGRGRAASTAVRAAVGQRGARGRGVPPRSGGDRRGTGAAPGRRRPVRPVRPAGTTCTCRL